MEQINRLRELAIENDAYSRQEKQLRDSMQDMLEYRELRDANKKMKLETSLKWGIFSSVEILFMILISNGLSYVLTLSMNQGMTQEEFIAAGGFGYRMIQVPMLIGAVPALPIAFFALFLVKKILRNRVKKENERNLRQNRINNTENTSVKAQNQRIKEHNHQISNQLEILKKRKQELEIRLKEENPLFPLEYLTVPVIDFVEQQLQSGQADNINQALVHYEVNIDDIS